MLQKIHDTIIIGSGPAGYTAALYTSRQNLSTLVIAGIKYGGQLMLTNEVENYPGFSNGIMGPNLMEEMEKQARRFGAEIIFDNVTSVNLKTWPIEISVGQKKFLSKTSIIATG